MNENKISNPLRNDILDAHKKLMQSIAKIPGNAFFKKSYDMSGVQVSTADIISYQIGWGELLIYWYQSGIQKIEVAMPGDGFDKWDYNGIALHFYKKYSHLSYDALLHTFNSVVATIIQIVDNESALGNLDKPGVWKWCTLKSGKEWPLSKWIRVNTIAPYKRAYKLIS